MSVCMCLCAHEIERELDKESKRTDVCAHATVCKRRSEDNFWDLVFSVLCASQGSDFSRKAWGASAFTYWTSFWILKDFLFVVRPCSPMWQGPLSIMVIVVVTSLRWLSQTVVTLVQKKSFLNRTIKNSRSN